MVLKNKKQGQAAIEFLMTYGWMLLVVLIVGALIFSFVDFGSLLPNKLDMAGDIRASASESFATAAVSDANVTVVFTYNGANRAQINYSDSYITPEVGLQCNSTYVENVNTDQVGNASNPVLVNFLNGQTGYMIFSCPSGLLRGDVLQGQIRINVESVTTGLSRPSVGSMRIAITD